MSLVGWMVAAVCAAFAGGILFWVLRSRRAGTTPARGETWADSSDVRRLLGEFQVQERETGYYGRWLEMRLSGVRVAFRIWQRGLEIFAGNFDPDRAPETEFELNFTPEGPDRNDLRRHPAPVREALAKLSPAVQGVQLYRSGGVELFVSRAQANPAGISADVEQAVALVQARARRERES